MQQFGDITSMMVYLMEKGKSDAVLVGGAAIRGGDHDVLQLMPADTDDGVALGVNGRLHVLIRVREFFPS